ncbi:MAG: hypothetical protein ACRYGB_03375 [Janthinobacterium lividum]
MNLLKKNPVRIEDWEMNVWLYMVLEYIGIYDDTDFVNRLRYLNVGASLFKKNGYSYHEYLEFHRSKARFISLTLKFICFVFFAYGVMIFLAGGSIFVLLISSLRAFCLCRMLVNSKRRSNIINLDKTLLTPTGIQNLHKIVEVSLCDESRITKLAKKFFWNEGEELEPDTFQSVPVPPILDLPFNEQIDNAPAASFHNKLLEITFKNEEGEELEPDTSQIVQTLPIPDSPFSEQRDNSPAVSFHDKLLKIASQKNKFNNMPMKEVINFFSIMCCKACEGEVPQMSEDDYIWFLDTAFLGGDNSTKISVSGRNNRAMYDVFHEFYNYSYDKGFTKKRNNREKYIRLLVDHFVDFDLKTVNDNFRTSINNYGQKIKDKYKDALQLIQL